MAKQIEENATPLVTVIIPMYNAEKYVAQCLQSLIDQTFQDFDVIVVNDCSTDNSVAEVQKFIPKFNGRLKLKSLPKNTGNSGIPKNTAVQIARGKYVTFLDSDDYFSPTALEGLVRVAEPTNADIVAPSHYFAFKDGTNEVGKGTFQRKYFVDRPVLETFDIGERVRKFTEYGFLWWGCNKLIRKDFLLENDIKFPPISVWEDLVFTFMCVTLAKNYVRVPNIFYFYRYREESLSHKPNDPYDILNTLMKVIKALNEFMEHTEFFQKNPQFRFMLLDWHIQGRMNLFCSFFFEANKFQPFQIDKLFAHRFKDIPPEYLSFMAYYFTTSAYQRWMIYQDSKEKAELQKKISDLEIKLIQNKFSS